MTAPSDGVKNRFARWLRWPDVLAVAWFALVVFLYLSPALKDGLSFGAADIGRGLSLLTQILPAPPLHNNINSDTITQGLPWNNLDWQLIHRGELPLWDSQAGTGLPQLFNFQSAPLSLPTAVGYLFPLSVSFLVTIAAKLLIAGTGAYVCCRVLGTGAIAGTFAGTTFMLSGSFSGWLGWPVSGPVAWGGWILAASILAYRSRKQVRHVLLLAVTVAFSIFGGFPESSVLLAIGLGVVILATGIATVALRRQVRSGGVARIGIGIVAGGALAAPLLLPGVSLLSGSARNGEVNAGGLSLHMATLIFAQGYFGLPTNGSFSWVNYYESTAYIGVIAIVLAAVAVLVAWRRPVVFGLLVAAIVSFLTIYQLGSGAPVQRLIANLGLSAVALQRMQSVLELVVAILAGLGLEITVHRWRERSTRVALLVSSVGVALVIAELWRGVDAARLPPSIAPRSNGTPTVAMLESLRRSSLLWPTASILLILSLVLVAFVLGKRARGEALRVAHAATFMLLVAQSAFLIFAGVGINTYSHDAYPVTPAVAAVRRIVGTTLLGLDGGNADCSPSAPHEHLYCGLRYWRDVGLYPEMNVAYGVDELAMYDPIIPQSYFNAWPVPNAAQVSRMVDLFAPDIDTVALARRYGVSYVLALSDEKPPQGMRFVTRLAGEVLYAVPDSAQFSFVGAGSTRATVVSASHPGDGRYVITVRVPHRATLAIRITDVSGWHASANGSSVRIIPYDGGMLSIEVPSGTHTIVLHYWPRQLTEGLALAGGTVLAFILWAGLLAARRRAVRSLQNSRAL